MNPKTKGSEFRVYAPGSPGSPGSPAQGAHPHLDTGGANPARKVSNLWGLSLQIPPTSYSLLMYWHCSFERVKNCSRVSFQASACVVTSKRFGPRIIFFKAI